MTGRKRNAGLIKLQVKKQRVCVCLLRSRSCLLATACECPEVPAENAPFGGEIKGESKGQAKIKPAASHQNKVPRTRKEGTHIRDTPDPTCFFFCPLSQRASLNARSEFPRLHPRPFLFPYYPPSCTLIKNTENYYCSHSNTLVFFVHMCTTPLLDRESPSRGLNCDAPLLSLCSYFFSFFSFVYCPRSFLAQRGVVYVLLLVISPPCANGNSSAWFLFLFFSDLHVYKQAAPAQRPVTTHIS